ncbi:MAG: hypothetical protein GQF41_3060 [Candidatus Rifleibacterium amylolyticum]|nr:MAG: hypothetical protein GQF41_3060 [Candidatus Rifleibacterium amylolyticum]
MLKRKCYLLTALIICVAINCSFAAPAVPILEPAKTPGADLKRILDDLQQKRIKRELNQEMENAEKSDKPAAAVSMPELAVPETRVTLNKIEFTGSSVLSQQKLTEFSAGYVGREIGIADLKDFIGKINDWYRSNGYITARAALPRQEIKAGVLKVFLIEGKIGRVIIQGNENTRSGYIRDRINVPAGKLLDIRSLDRDLIWFNGTNDMKARIKLQAGEKTGTTDCYILAYEPEDKICNLFVDTAGNKSTGETRVGFSYADASVTGNRDSLSLTTLMSDSSKAQMLGYSSPVNRYGTRLAFYLSRNTLEVESSGLDISGKSEMIGFSLTHPLHISRNFKSELIFDAQSQRSSNQVLNMNFVDDREKRYSIGQSFLKLSPGQALYFRPMLILCDYKGLAESRKVQKSSFDALWQKINRGRQQLMIQLNGQKAQDDNMPSADQYFLGGLNSVRGYDESVISGDSGLNIKCDYRFPLPGCRRTNMAVFYDWGRIYGKSFVATRMIHSAGFGLIHSFANDSQISLSVGYPITRRIGATDVNPHRLEMQMSISL